MMSPDTSRAAFYEGRALLRAREADRHYHRLVERYCGFLIPAGARVLELGCGLGDLLASTKPARGLGGPRDEDYWPTLIYQRNGNCADLRKHDPKGRCDCDRKLDCHFRVLSIANPRLFSKLLCKYLHDAREKNVSADFCGVH